MSRYLEIGPGKTPIPGFETVGLNRHARHRADARRLPFEDCSFDVVYSSHCIEHIAWYETLTALKEWRRVLVPGGVLEVWTVNALKIAEAMVEYEATGKWQDRDGWKRYNLERNPYKWMAGRIFAYSSKNDPGDANWHRALFTPKYLMQCFEEAGFTFVRLMDRSEVRGKDHGWINLGVQGLRP